LFNGLNNVYKKHNILGQYAFIMLLFHPLLLLPRYAASNKEAAAFLFFSSDFARNFGIFSLALMILLIVLTLYLKPKYNLWKITHKFFGLALFLGGLHAFLIPSFVMQNPPLSIYVLGFAVLGLTAFTYRTLLGWLLVKKYDYSVEKIIKLDDEVVEISLKPLKNKINYQSGQFIFIAFKQAGLTSESHPFSISSSPDEEYLKITVKKLGDFTGKLFQVLQTGASAKIEGPFGIFSYQKSNNHDQIWIAGGIGITPFVGMAKNLLHDAKDYNIYLFYCIKEEEKAVYADLLKKIEQTISSSLKVILFYSNENGRISFAKIKNLTDKAFQRDAFICAPPKMIASLTADFVNNGVNKYQIHSEEFNF